MKTARLILVAMTLVCASGAVAQDTSRRTNYGEVSLDSGFNNDPRVVALQAGGDISAQRAGTNCAGYITDAPDYRVFYNAGSLPLIISVASDADTTLVVNAPDGRFYCDDDGGVNGANPSVRFSNPQSGRYEIWVGTYSSGNAQPARLHISEVSSQ
jgi:hypothetical protein